MKKIIAILLLCALTLTLGACSSGGGEDELVIFTWANYLPQDMLDRFTEETGIRVNYTYFTSNDEMLAKLQAVNGGDYDLILASDYAIDIARKEGLLQKLNLDDIPNFKDIDPAFQSKFYDETNEYTVPFSAGTPLIVYDPAKVDIDIDGYNDLWDPSLRDSLVVIDDARVMIGITLMSMGHPMNTTDEAVLQQAADKLMQLRPNIRAFDYDTPYEKMISGETAVGFMFTPQANWAVTERPDLQVVYPEEGLGFGIDSFFIPSNAPHADNASRFLNFILQGDVSAELSEFSQYMNCVTTAKEYLSEEYLNNKVLYVPSELLTDAQFVEDVGSAAQEIYNNIWTAFKQS